MTQFFDIVYTGKCRKDLLICLRSDFTCKTLKFNSYSQKKNELFLENKIIMIDIQFFLIRIRKDVIRCKFSLFFLFPSFCVHFKSFKKIKITYSRDISPRILNWSFTRQQNPFYFNLVKVSCSEDLYFSKVTIESYHLNIKDICQKIQMMVSIG